MAATSAQTRLAIKRQFFSLAKEIRGTTNFFGRKRKNYLTAVVEGDWNAVRETETKLVERLRREKNRAINNVLSNAKLSDKLVSFLRMGIPLSNALKITILESNFPAIDSLHLPHSSRHRKPEVLRHELEIIKFEYESLRLARTNAEKFGLTAIEAKLRKKLVGRAKLIAAYQKIFSTRLIE